MQTLKLNVKRTELITRLEERLAEQQAKLVEAKAKAEAETAAAVQQLAKQLVAFQKLLKTDSAEALKKVNIGSGGVSVWLESVFLPDRWHRGYSEQRNIEALEQLLKPLRLATDETIKLATNDEYSFWL